MRNLLILLLLLVFPLCMAMEKKGDAEKKYENRYKRQYDDAKLLANSRIGRDILLQMIGTEITNGRHTPNASLAKLAALWDLREGKPNRFGKE